MILSKLSIGIFLLRIINAGQRLHQWILYVVMFITSLTGVIFFLASLLQCRPMSFFWDKTSPEDGMCMSADVIIFLAYLYSVFSIFCDFTFALLPVAIILKLNMSLRLKLASIPLLTMGCVASSGVVMRLFYVHTFRAPDFLCRQMLLPSSPLPRT